MQHSLGGRAVDCETISWEFEPGLCYENFLNQAQRLAHDWFLETAFVCNVSMRVCVCVSTPKAVNK